MKKYSFILLALTTVSCAEGQVKNIQAENTAKVAKPIRDTVKTPATLNTTPEIIIRERAQGTVTLFNTISGKPIIQVNDNVMLEAAIPEKGWASTLVTTEVSEEKGEGEIMKKGSPIIVNGKQVGKLLEDVEIVSAYKNDKGVNLAVFYAVVQQNKLKPSTIIENALATYLKEHPERSLKEMKTFIKQFQLVKLDMHEPFVVYYNYESSADDPSPGFRTVLVFYENKLIGVVDSRTAQLESTTYYKLAMGYRGYFFNDTPEALRKKYISLFNELANSAD